jgi:hypothetical protein
MAEGLGEGAAPSVWPFVVGLALSFALFGIVTSLVFTAAGVIGVALGIAGWIHDLRREARDGD